MQDKGAYGSVPTRLKVADILVNYGKDVSFTRNGLIKSPFRNERTPSFHIMPEGYGWVDFGDGTKGGVIDLIMRLENCDRSFALRRIAEIKNGGRFFVQPSAAVSLKTHRPAHAFKVMSSSPLTDNNLIQYAVGRGITEDVLRRYCREIAVKVRGSKNILSYIGFPNSTDGTCHSESGQKVSHPIASETERLSFQQIRHRIQCTDELLEFIRIAGGDVVCAGPVWHSL